MSGLDVEVPHAPTQGAVPVGNALTAALSRIDARLDAIAADVSALAERQRRVDDLLSEASPIVKEVMGVAVNRLQEAEDAGYFRAGRAAASAIDRVVRQHPDEIDGLGDDLVRILDTLRALTRPEVLQVAAEAAEVVERRDDIAPLGVMGLVRASTDAEVQRGLAVMMELIRHVGRAADRVASGRAGASEQLPPGSPRSSGATSGGVTPGRPTAGPAPAVSPSGPPRSGPPAGRTVHKGLEALAPRLRRAAPAGPACGTPTAPGPAVAMVDGVAYTADGGLADPTQWTRAIGAALAAQANVTMTDAHWALVDFARKEFLETGASPNIRRLSLGAGVSTRDIYTLFPKAPGRTLARIAGVPKPAGCL